MSVDELRAGLARAAATVVPPEDPYGRLLRHARRRRRVRRTAFGAALAGALAALLVVPATGVGVGGVTGWLRDDGPTEAGYAVNSPWVWRLIDSPTRGNLAGDRRLVDELTRVFTAGRGDSGMGRLPEVKVLFVHEAGGHRQVAVAYHSDRAAALAVHQAPAGATARQLLHGSAFGNAPLLPFTVLGGVDGNDVRQVTGLAPEGCAVSWAETGTVRPDGTIGRAWRPSPTPGYLHLTDPHVRGWWRVECDGEVREQGPVGFGVSEVSGRSEALAPPSGTPTDLADVVGTRAAAQSTYRILTGASGLAAEPVLRWSGRLPDGTAAAVVTGGTDGSPALLQLGPNGDALLALAPPEDATPDDTETMAASRADWALASTGSGSGELTAVRLPVRAGGHAELDDRVLVVVPKGATGVEARRPDGSTTVGTVTDGVAVVPLPVGKQATLVARDARGTTLASAEFREPIFGPRLFGESLLSAW
ncbi:hypothetical protein K7640_18915 [Micromonospora sp. PLK6-60]|uniref:hypothetical protein n=1 Tax=Micromonospora sp. PLK6-60 TaxID=2873383 RepID=UPI001CA6B72F|nr:hypothetical protein [Micromonospora sp. PLK6-60]MBY8873905.1 hypothetical protein [Micromonospora sp. PLK6-60]